MDAYAAAGLSHILFSPPVATAGELSAAMKTIAQDVRALVTA